MEIAPENHLPTYKERSGGEVFKNPISGGAGDVSLSPPQEHRHTPALSLGAVRVPAFAPEGGEVTSTPKPLRILLSETASRHLENHGGECFLIVSMDKSDHHHGRMVLHLIPTTYNLANAGLRVAQGTSTEKRPRPAPEPSPAALTPAEIRMA